MPKTNYRRCTCDPCATVKLLTGKPQPLTDKELNDIRLNLFTERNNDKTFYLILHGKEIFQRYMRRLIDQDIRSICRYISSTSKRITLLDLSYNNITDAGFKLLLKHLLVNGKSSVLNLNIMENNLTAKSLIYLKEVAPMVRLKCLRLAGNMIGYEAECGKSLADFLINNSTLECLDVGETQLNFTSLAYITSALQIGRGGNKSIKYLDLSRLLPLFNRYDLEPKWVIYHIQVLLEHNDTLVELHLQKNELTSHDMESLVMGLARNKSLQCLDLGFNRIMGHGLEILSRHFETGSKLVYLNVAGNSIEDYGAIALSYGLPHTQIRALDLSKNNLTDTGIQGVLFVSQKSEPIRFLNIWGNQIGDASCRILKRMVDDGTLFQHAVDFKIYETDGKLYAAYYPNPSDIYKQLYYNLQYYAYAQPIYHIKRNIKQYKKVIKLDGKHRHKPDTVYTC